MICLTVRVSFSGGSAVIAGRFTEVFEERAVETVEDCKVRLIRELLAFSRSSAEHLLEQNARLHRSKEDDEFQVRNINAGREHIDTDDDVRFGPIAELADSLQRSVDISGSGNLLDERIAAAENIARDVDKTIGVGRVWQVVYGEDQRLREIDRNALDAPVRIS